MLGTTKSELHRTLRRQAELAAEQVSLQYNTEFQKKVLGFDRYKGQEEAEMLN